MKIKKMAIILIIGLSCSILLSSCDDRTSKTRSLFSWKENEVVEGKEELFQMMESLKLNTLYQHFSSKLNEAEIKKFLLGAKKRDIEVYLLDGDPKWALEKDGGPMIETIERVIKINSKLDENIRIKSIVFDIEPYTLDEWDDEEKRDEIMDRFSNGMQIAYKKAKENNLEVINCIPYFYDSKGFSKQLEELIKSGSDGIAIMNYMKTKEVKNIEGEVELADKYGKKIINIYELQAPGEHGLEEKNTYYNDGIEEVEKNFENIIEEFPDKEISIAFHEYKALKEVFYRE